MKKIKNVEIFDFHTSICDQGNETFSGDFARNPQARTLGCIQGNTMRGLEAAVHSAAKRFSQNYDVSDEVIVRVYQPDPEARFRVFQDYAVST